MDQDETVTVCKVYTPNGDCYLLIFWFANSFELFLYTKNKLWKGKFLSDRLESFSKNLQLTEDTYLARIKECLSEQRNDYFYEFKNGFFCWKRKWEHAVIIEGFLPLDLDTTPIGTDPNFIEALINVNQHLREKLYQLETKLTTIKIDYQEHLADTEDFLNLKEKMEKFLCQKFLKLIYLKKSKIKLLDSKASINLKIIENILIDGEDYYYSE